MKYSTQNAKIESITEKTLIVGIDIGSETHFARAFDWRDYEYTRKSFEFSNNAAGFQAFKAWIGELLEKYGKSVVIPGMEPTGHYWFALEKFLPPKTIAGLVNEGRFSYPYIPTGIYAETRSLSNLWFQAQEELTRDKNRIARWFSTYFPEYKDVYRDLKAVSGRWCGRQLRCRRTSENWALKV